MKVAMNPTQINVTQTQTSLQMVEGYYTLTNDFSIDSTLNASTNELAKIKGLNPIVKFQKGQKVYGTFIPNIGVATSSYPSVAGSPNVSIPLNNFSTILEEYNKNLLLNNNATPDLLSLNMSVARQNKYIFDLLLEKYNIIPNNTTMNEISEIFNNEINIYFLNRLIKKNVYPDLNTLTIFIYSNNLNIIEIIIKYIPPQIIYVDSLSDVSSTIIEYLNNNGFQLQQNQNNIDNNEYM
jgi:hypothetical protein